VGQVCARKSWSAASQDEKLHILSQRNFAGVHAQNLFPAAHIRVTYHYAPVKAPRTQQCRVKHVRTIGRRHENDAFVRLETVHFHQQLVQRLLALIVATAQSRAAMASYRVNFVNEYDAGGIFLALFEQITHPARAISDEHFHKVGAGNREERNIGFACNRPSQQRFTCARRSNQQNSLGNPPTQFLELLRLAQELDDLPEFFFGLIHASHVLERNLFLLHREEACPALAEKQGFITASLHLPDHEEPQRSQKEEGSPGAQQLEGPAAVVDIFDGDLNVLIIEGLVHLRIARRDNGMKGGVVAILAADFLAENSDFLNVPLVHVTEELAEIHNLVLLPVAAHLDDLPQQQSGNPYDQPKHHSFYC